MITSLLPGRARVRLPAGFADEAVATLKAALAKAAPGCEMKHNPRSGGLLVTWKPGVKRDAAVAKVLGAVAGPVSQCRVKLAWPSMKTVKQGMAASLGVALTALAFKSERVHMWAGGTFTVLLSRHLYVYRKRLFK